MIRNGEKTGGREWDRRGTWRGRDRVRKGGFREAQKWTERESEQRGDPEGQGAWDGGREGPGKRKGLGRKQMERGLWETRLGCREKWRGKGG